jgi:hypothetical protein
MGNMKHQHREHRRYGIGRDQQRPVLSLVADYERRKRDEKILSVVIETVAALVVGGLLIMIMTIGVQL